MDKAEQKHQNKMALQSLIEASGMRIFKADLSDLMSYADSEINSCKKGFVPENKMAKLNYDLGRKAGLEMVLNTLQGYEDELVGDDVNSQK